MTMYVKQKKQMIRNVQQFIDGTLERHLYFQWIWVRFFSVEEAENSGGIKTHIILLLETEVKWYVVNDT